MVSLMLPDLRAERSRNGDPTPLLRGLALGVAPAPVPEPVFVELDIELRRPLLQALLNLVHGPQTVVDRIVPELQRIGRKPEVISRVKSIGGQVVCSTPEVLAERVRGDIAKWRDLARRADIRAE